MMDSSITLEHHHLDCFICFKDVSLLQSSGIETTDSDGITLITKLKYCLDSTTLIESKLMVLCDECVAQLQLCYGFKQLARKSQERHFMMKFSNQGSITTTAVNSAGTNSKQVKVEYVEMDDEPVIDLQQQKEPVSPSSEKEDVIVIDQQAIDLWPETEQYVFEVLHDDEGSLQAGEDDEMVQSVLQHHAATTAPKVTRLKPEKMFDDGPCSWTCDYCGEEYYNHTNFQRHIKRFHADAYKHMCEICGRKYTTAFNLKEHLYSHRGEKNYSCSMCDAKFLRLSSQRRHMETHKRAPGEKSKKTPFLCTLCGKWFPFSNGVQRHMRVHFGIKRFQCRFCDKRFAQNQQRVVHERTHTGEKPYICELCGRTFSIRAGLLQHIKKHHSKSELRMQMLPKLESLDETTFSIPYDDL